MNHIKLSSHNRYRYSAVNNSILCILWELYQHIYEIIYLKELFLNHSDKHCTELLCIYYIYGFIELIFNNRLHISTEQDYLTWYNLTSSHLHFDVAAISLWVSKNVNNLNRYWKSGIWFFTPILYFVNIISICNWFLVSLPLT